MKNKTPIIAAVILGILAVVAVKAYVGNIEAKYAARDRGTRVVAAKTDIPAGAELVIKDMLTPKEIPERFLHPQTILEKDVKLVAGQKARIPIREGTALLWSDLVSERRGGFESIIPPDERAFTVTIPKGVQGGLVQPNDHIDILVTFSLPESKKIADKAPTAAVWRERSDMVNIVLLQNVTVLAIGGMYMAETQEAGSPNEFTVAVTLQEAQLLMFAAEHGDLGAVLRKYDDIKTIDRAELPRITFQELETLVGDLDGKRKRRIVEVKKGEEIEEVVVEEKSEP